MAAKKITLASLATLIEKGFTSGDKKFVAGDDAAMLKSGRDWSASFTYLTMEKFWDTKGGHKRVAASATGTQ